MRDQTIVVISDVQAPYEDAPAVRAVQEFVKDYQPDMLACVGDEADSPEPSRWNKGLAAEYMGTLQAGLDRVHDIMSGFRTAVGDKPFIVQRSNHGDRIARYVERYAPALASLRDLHYSKLLGYDILDIDFRDQQLTDLVPGWIMAHGDEGGSSRLPGGLAMAIARSTGKSCIAGHSHKLSIQHDHRSYNGKISQRLYGFETGHLMDLKAAAKMYLKTGGANWQSGFGILRVVDNAVFPIPVPIIDKKFIVDGQVYRWK